MIYFLSLRLCVLRRALVQSWNECISTLERLTKPASARVRQTWTSLVGGGGRRRGQDNAYSFHFSFRTRVIPTVFSRLFIASWLIVFVNGPEGAAQADVSTATLTGKVTDQSGADVIDAAVTVTSVERGSVRSATSNYEGMYRILLLQPGLYTIRVTSPGFRPQILNEISLTVGQTAVADVQLQVGPVSADLVVPAEATLVETQ